MQNECDRRAESSASDLSPFRRWGIRPAYLIRPCAAGSPRVPKLPDGTGDALARVWRARPKQATERHAFSCAD